MCKKVWKGARWRSKVPFLAVQDSSIGDIVTQSMSQTFYFSVTMTTITTMNTMSTMTTVTAMTTITKMTTETARGLYYFQKWSFL